MATIGAAAPAASPSQSLRVAHERAASLPDLLVEARRLANTVVNGWHGRRRKGAGEKFWQFRPYGVGESATRIDWRRSARDDSAYVRDREWEAAQTIWLSADRSPSMRFRSTTARVSKEERAIILVLALAELLSRGGERIGWPGLMSPLSARNAAERLAMRLVHAGDDTNAGDLSPIRRFAEYVHVSDFLDDPDIILARLQPLAARGVRGHLVEVADPAEEDFPYGGRTEFRDPETGGRFIAGRAEALAADYRHLYRARREELSRWCARHGWTHVVSRTDRIASEALGAVARALGEPAGSRR